VAEPYSLDWWLNVVIGSILGTLLVFAFFSFLIFLKLLIRKRRYYRSTRNYMRNYKKAVKLRHKNSKESAR
jgi:hypothetical protein